MKAFLYKWVKSNRVMLVNSGSLVGTTLSNSAIGFAFWWVATRRFPLDAVGIASASVSIMTLLASFSIVGLGTLLITELPRHPNQTGELISTALITVGLVGNGVGVVFVIVASHLSPGFKPLGEDILHIVIFACGVSLSGITLVLDSALIGLLRGGLQFWRNVLFNLVKLVALLLLSFLVQNTDGIVIYAAWATGNLISIIVFALLAVYNKGCVGKNWYPQRKLLRKLGGVAVQHHLLNVAVQAPALTLPMLVTIFLSAKMNAWFYVSWMIVNFIFYIPTALTMVLHAMNSAQQFMIARRIRTTLSIALLIGVVGTCLLQFSSRQVLSLFGSSYEEQATWVLRILVVAAFPLTIKSHYIAICRIYDRQKSALLLVIPGGLLEMLGAALGAYSGGLVGLSLVWTAAVYIESAFMFRTVFNVLSSKERSADFIGGESLWLMNTLPLPAINQGDGRLDAAWLMNTLPLPAINQGDGRLDAAWLILPALTLPTLEQAKKRRTDQKSLFLESRQ